MDERAIFFTLTFFLVCVRQFKELLARAQVVRYSIISDRKKNAD